MNSNPVVVKVGKRWSYKLKAYRKSRFVAVVGGLQDLVTTSAWPRTILRSGTIYIRPDRETISGVTSPVVSSQ